FQFLALLGILWRDQHRRRVWISLLPGQPQNLRTGEGSARRTTRPWPDYPSVVSRLLPPAFSACIILRAPVARHLGHHLLRSGWRLWRSLLPVESRTGRSANRSTSRAERRPQP